MPPRRKPEAPQIQFAPPDVDPTEWQRHIADMNDQVNGLVARLDAEYRIDQLRRARLGHKVVKLRDFDLD